MCSDFRHPSIRWKFLISVADLHQSDEDPDQDPSYHFDADPDPTLHFDADPDPDPGTVLIKVMQICDRSSRDPSWLHFEAPQLLNFYFDADSAFTSIQIRIAAFISNFA